MKRKPSRNLFLDCPIELMFTRKAIRELYSAYLNGASMEALADLLFYRKGHHYDPLEISAAIDRLNEAFL